MQMVHEGVRCPRRPALSGKSRRRGRDPHQEFAEIFTAQEADKGARGVLEALDNVSAILDPALADPGGDIAHEIPIARSEVGNDEAAKRQSLGQDRSHQVRQ